MAEWLRKIQKSFSKKSDKTEAPEDFILLRPLSDESAENHQASPEIDGGANSASSSQINDNVSSPSFEELYKQVYHEDFPDDLGELSDSETARQTAEADLSNTSELDVTQIDAGLDEPEAEVLAPYAPKHEDDQADLTETTFLPLDELESKLEEKPSKASHNRAVGVGGNSLFHQFKERFDRRKVLIVAGTVAAALVVVASGAYTIFVLANPLRSYSQVAVSKGNVIRSMETGGTVEASARYEITSLVSGAVIESKPEVGDTVTEGAVLYQLDDTDAQLAVKRAQNEVDKSKAVGTQAQSQNSSLKIFATDAGVIQSLSIQKGSSVSAGSVIGTLKRSDDTIVSIVSSVSGTVSATSVKKGQSVQTGQLIAMVTNSALEATQKSSVYDQKSNELDLEMAKKQLENYTIKSPVSGVVVEKNTKTGDNVGITNLDNPMMVIVDTNTMRFTFQVDEYQVWEIEKGQSAILTTPSIPNTTFSGEVSRIASEGKTDDQGKTTFEVDVTVSEPGDLKAGMKVDAKIILASATNVLTLPEDALMEADGQNALVFVKQTQDDIDAAKRDGQEASDEELAFPWIKVPKGCALTTVKYGIADGTNVQILSGISVGDIVVYTPQEGDKELPTSTLEDDTVIPEAGTDSSVTRGGNGGLDNTLPSSSSSPKGSNSQTEDDIRRQIDEQLNNTGSSGSTKNQFDL